MSPTRQQIGRAVKVFGTVLFLAVFALVLGGYLERGTTNNRLTSILSRRSPVTDYYIATTQTDACRSTLDARYKAHSDAFSSDVATVLITAATRTPEETELLRAAVAYDKALMDADEAQLQAIDKLCPYPAPPVFDAEGDILSPPGTGPSIPAAPVVTTPPLPTTN